MKVTQTLIWEKLTQQNRMCEIAMARREKKLTWRYSGRSLIQHSCSIQVISIQCNCRWDMWYIYTGYRYSDCWFHIYRYCYRAAFIGKVMSLHRCTRDLHKRNRWMKRDKDEMKRIKRLVKNNDKDWEIGAALTKWGGEEEKI